MQIAVLVLFANLFLNIGHPNRHPTVFGLLKCDKNVKMPTLLDLPLDTAVRKHFILGTALSLNNFSYSTSFWSDGLWGS